jgi:hypothetical protein
LDAGDNFDLTYDVEVEDGALRFELLDPDRDVIWEASIMADKEDVVRFQAEKSGRYVLKINGDQTKGGFDLHWETSD